MQKKRDAPPKHIWVQLRSTVYQFSKIQDILGSILPEFHDGIKKAASETAPPAVSGNNDISHDISAQRTERDT